MTHDPVDQIEILLVEDNEDDINKSLTQKAKVLDGQAAKRILVQTMIMADGAQQKHGWIGNHV